LRKGVLWCYNENPAGIVRLEIHTLVHVGVPVRVRLTSGWLNP
jgi:hypothetical protein